jgi:WD40 repeat protein
VAFTPDGQRILVSLNQGPPVLCDEVSGQPLPGPPLADGPWACSEDGHWLAVAGADGLRLRDLTTAQEVVTVRGIRGVPRLAFSPDGRLVASAGGEGQEPGEVRVWDASPAGGGQERHRLPGLPAPVVGMAFSKDGRQLTSVAADGTLKVWGTGRGEELYAGKLAVGGLDGVAFSPDGRALAFLDDDKHFRIQDLSRGREVGVIAGHDGGVEFARFSPDGRRFITKGRGEIKFWDSATGQELATFAVSGVGHGFILSPDGGRLAMGSGEALTLLDGRELTPEVAVEREAVGLLDQLFTRPLTRQGVLDFLGTSPALSNAVRQRAVELAARYREDEDPGHYAGAARRLARQPDLPPLWYRQALRQAEAACALAGQDGACLTTLGMAQYRLGRWQEALATAARADRLNAEGQGGSVPADLAVLALAHLRLGNEEQARAYLARLRQRLGDERWARDEEARDLLREVEQRLGPG